VIRPVGEKDMKIPSGKFKFGSFYTPMMILFTRNKKILGVKGSKPNFTSRDDALFPNPADHYFPPKATGIYLKGYKEPRDYRSKKEE